MSDNSMVARSNIKPFIPLLSELSDGIHPPYQSTFPRTRLIGQGLQGMGSYIEAMSPTEVEQLFGTMNAMMVDANKQSSKG
jgi:hypothetical protein